MFSRLFSYTSGARPMRHIAARKPLKTIGLALAHLETDKSFVFLHLQNQLVCSGLTYIDIENRNSFSSKEVAQIQTPASTYKVLSNKVLTSRVLHGTIETWKAQR
jgi:hypothetical protein